MFLPSSVIAILLFAGFALMVALAISHMLMRGDKERQGAYASFAGHVNEFLLFMSEEGLIQGALPKFVQDPLFEQVIQKRSLIEILKPEDQT